MWILQWLLDCSPGTIDERSQQYAAVQSQSLLYVLVQIHAEAMISTGLLWAVVTLLCTALMLGVAVAQEVGVQQTTCIAVPLSSFVIRPA